LLHFSLSLVNQNKLTVINRQEEEDIIS
jgi:hypothetical protein